MSPRGTARRLLSGVSPRGFLLRAGLIALLFLLLHAGGLRGCTTFLSGTLPAPGIRGEILALLGICYAVAWFAFVLASPVLVLAAGLFALLDRLLPGRAPRAAR